MEKIEYATLIINQNPSYIVKVYLTDDDQQNLHLKLKKCRNFGRKDWDPINIKSVINFSIRLNKVKELIQLISNDKEALNVVRTIYFQDIFLFTYDVQKLADVNSDFFNPKHNVYNFKEGVIVAVKF